MKQTNEWPDLETLTDAEVELLARHGRTASLRRAAADELLWRVRVGLPEPGTWSLDGPA